MDGRSLLGCRESPAHIRWSNGSAGGARHLCIRNGRRQSGRTVRSRLRRRQSLLLGSEGNGCLTGLVGAHRTGSSHPTTNSLRRPTAMPITPGRRRPTPRRQRRRPELHRGPNVTLPVLLSIPHSGDRIPVWGGGGPPPVAQTRMGVPNRNSAATSSIVRKRTPSWLCM